MSAGKTPAAIAAEAIEADVLDRRDRGELRQCDPAIRKQIRAAWTAIIAQATLDACEQAAPRVRAEGVAEGLRMAADGQPYASLHEIRRVNAQQAEPLPDWELLWTIYREAACRLGRRKSVSAVPGGLEAVANAARAEGVADGLRMAAAEARARMATALRYQQKGANVALYLAAWCEARAEGET